MGLNLELISNNYYHCVPFKKIWHLVSQQISTIQSIRIAEVAKQLMEIATLTL